MVRRFHAGIQQPQLQQEEPVMTTRVLTEEELIQQQIQENQAQIQPLQSKLSSLEQELIHRHKVKDSTTIRFLNAEIKATSEVIAALQQGKIVDPQQADVFIKRTRDLISFTFDPKQPTQQEQILQAEREGLKPIYKDGKLVGFSDEQQKMTIPIEHAVGTIGKARLERAGFEVTETTTTRQLTPQEQVKVQAWSDKFKMSPTPETIQKIISKPTVTSRSEFLGDLQVLQGISLFGQEEIVRTTDVPEEKGLSSSITRQQDILLTARGRGKGSIIGEATLFGLSAVSPFVRLGEAVLSPVETTKSLFYATTHPIQTVTSIREAAVKKVQLDPSGFIGQLGGEYALLRTPTLITKGTDIVRTATLTEVPSELVIAPEFFKGQKFPTIKKGQTAGTLLKEFKVEGAGYTAAPKPFKKTTIALRGTSELAGIYQAPKVSPHFLRVSGEEAKVFSLSIFDTLRPSVMKTKPLSFELVPSVSFSQKEMASLSRTKEFFETAPKGKSFVPFVKTEKEAIIPFGTELKQVRRTTFFKFEGRRIPISEFETIPSKVEGKIIKTLKIEDISTLSSRGRIRKRGAITPLEITSFSKSVSVSKGISKPFSSSYISSKSLSSSLPSMASYSKQSSVSVSKLTSYGRGSISRPSIISKLSSKKYSPSYSSYLGSSKRVPPPITRPPPPPPPPIFFKLKTPKTTKRARGTYGVSVRRFGIFRPIGKGLTLRKAFEVGERRVGRTLAATFKITPEKKGVKFSSFKTPKGFRRKKGLLFIEKRKHRLSTGTEIKEIQFAKLKGGLYK